MENITKRHVFHGKINRSHCPKFSKYFGLIHYYMPNFLNDGRNTDDSQDILGKFKDIPKLQNLIHSIYYSKD